MSEQPSELTCRELTALISTYLDDALSAEDRTRFERHLAHCVGCQRYVAQFWRTIELTGRVGAVNLTVEERKELRAAFRGWRG